MKLSDMCVFWPLELALFLTTQEKRKIPPVPNGVTDLGEAEDHGGHGGPELQRTGR